jgi:GNAT superfamily N-acetyltransferase
MFEPITDADVPAIVVLMNRAYRGPASATAWNSEGAHISGDRTTEVLLRAELLAKPSGCYLKWVERPGEEPIGCVWLEPMPADVWYLGSLAGDPDRQNEGLGRKLLAAAENWVRRRGGVGIRMTVINVRDADPRRPQFRRVGARSPVTLIRHAVRLRTGPWSPNIARWRSISARRCARRRSSSPRA